ncbi:hypothetical protein OH76DRAFT_477625 [Lentinus brumalis]|uniref:Uncharacterized protein n=1 Tax=Lentinus brumalis TaxID=2498619 RepID=A0A371DBW1_9APHY|nr:hypothetical protein OH76DRAFT_477625 [Polyporus brumalis]
MELLLDKPIKSRSQTVRARPKREGEWTPPRTRPSYRHGSVSSLSRFPARFGRDSTAPLTSGWRDYYRSALVICTSSCEVRHGRMDVGCKEHNRQVAAGGTSIGPRTQAGNSATWAAWERQARRSPPLAVVRRISFNLWFLPSACPKATCWCT